jgi:transcriptional regulator with XRE-family HTH domain
MRTREVAPAVDKLAQWLESKGWSQGELAEAIGIKQQSVSQWMTADSRPEAHLRMSIEVLTEKTVLVADWMFRNERQAFEKLQQRVSPSQSAA